MELFGLKRYVLVFLILFHSFMVYFLYGVQSEVKPVQPEVKPVQDLLNAQRKALRKQSNSLRLAIETDVKNIAFQLCEAGLIPSYTRDNKDAAEMLSTIEKQLQLDGSVWDKLLLVLKNCNQTAVVAKLSCQVAEEITSGSNSQTRQ